MKEAYQITRHTQPIFLMGAALGVSAGLGLIFGLIAFVFVRAAYPHHGWPVFIVLGVLGSIAVFAVLVHGHIQKWKQCNPSGTEKRS